MSDDRGAPEKCPVAAITGHSLRTGRKAATSSGGAAASKSTLAFRGCFERDSWTRGQSRKVHPKFSEIHLDSPETRTKRAGACRSMDGGGQRAHRAAARYMVAPPGLCS